MSAWRGRRDAHGVYFVGALTSILFSLFGAPWHATPQASVRSIVAPTLRDLLAAANEVAGSMETYRKVPETVEIGADRYNSAVMALLVLDCIAETPGEM